MGDAAHSVVLDSTALDTNIRLRDRSLELEDTAKQLEQVIIIVPHFIIRLYLHGGRKIMTSLNSWRWFARRVRCLVRPSQGDSHTLNTVTIISFVAVCGDYPLLTSSGSDHVRKLQEKINTLNAELVEFHRSKSEVRSTLRHPCCLVYYSVSAGDG